VVLAWLEAALSLARALGLAEKTAQTWRDVLAGCGTTGALA